MQKTVGPDLVVDGRLSQARRAELATAIVWLEELREAVGEETKAAVAVPMALLEQAREGEQIKLEEYHRGVEEEQSGWKIGGAVNGALPVWRVAFPDAWDFLAQLKNGMHWVWLTVEQRWDVMENAEPGTFQEFRPGKMTEQQARQLDAMLLTSLHHGVIRPVMETDRPGSANLLFPVPKPAEPGVEVQYRWVLDLSRWNALLEVPSFRMQGESYMRATLERGMWMALTDFRKAFWLLLMAPSFAALQRFHGPSATDRAGTADAGPPPIPGQVQDRRQRRLWEMVVCAMGSGPSSKEFSKFPIKLVQKTSTFGIEASTYTDEVNAVDHCRTWCYLSMMVIAVAAHMLRLMMSWEKFCWLPMQVQKYIGFEWNLLLFRRSLTQKRLRDMAATANELEVAAISEVPVTLKLVSRAQGQAMNGAGGCRMLGLKVRGLREWLRYQLSVNGQDHSAKVVVCKTLIPFLRYLQNIPEEHNWSWIRNEASVILFSADASEYSACMHRVPMRNAADKMIWYFTQAEQREHHNQQEDMARRQGLMHFILKDDLKGSLLQPLAIGCETDNKVVEKSWEHLKTRSTTMAAALEPFQAFLDSRYLQLNMSFRSGMFMQLRRQTDAGSRMMSRWYNWRLRAFFRNAVLQHFRLHAEVMVDLFAEASTAQFQRFVSRNFHQEALWLDAMSQQWTASHGKLQAADVLWVFPPPALIKKILDKLKSEQAFRLPVVLILPNTPTTSWFLRLKQLWPAAVATALKLPLWNVACQPLEEGKVKTSKLDIPPAWGLIACRL